jgi:hypothetical protein
MFGYMKYKIGNALLHGDNLVPRLARLLKTERTNTNRDFRFS